MPRQRHGRLPESGESHAADAAQKDGQLSAEGQRREEPDRVLRKHHRRQLQRRLPRHGPARDRHGPERHHPELCLCGRHRAAYGEPRQDGRQRGQLRLLRLHEAANRGAGRGLQSHRGGQLRLLRLQHAGEPHAARHDPHDRQSHDPGLHGAEDAAHRGLRGRDGAHVRDALHRSGRRAEDRDPRRRRDEAGRQRPRQLRRHYALRLCEAGDAEAREPPRLHRQLRLLQGGPQGDRAQEGRDGEEQRLLRLRQADQSDPARREQRLLSVQCLYKSGRDRNQVRQDRKLCFRGLHAAEYDQAARGRDFDRQLRVPELHGADALRDPGQRNELRREHDPGLHEHHISADRRECGRRCDERFLQHLCQSLLHR